MYITEEEEEEKDEEEENSERKTKSNSINTYIYSIFCKKAIFDSFQK